MNRKLDDDKRITSFEEDFKKRYNRDVKIWREVFVEGIKFNKAVIDIEYSGSTYVLTEYLTEEQATDYVTLDINDKSHRYKRYIDAEIHVADLIGEQNGNSN